MDNLDAMSIDAFDEFELTDEYPETSLEEIQLSQDQETEENSNQNLDLENTLDNQQLNIQDSEDSEDSEKSSTNTDEFISEILKIKGISSPDKIKFLDESGAIIDRAWNDLTTNEKLSVLTLEEDTDTDLDDEEIEFINMLRGNNLTPSLYIELFKNNIILHILDNLRPNYEIDSLTDDELFALDLIERLGEDNVTDEELQLALEQAKSNEALYQKLVTALRERYENLEDQRKYEEELTLQMLLEQNYRYFSENILNLIEGFERIAGQEIELSVDDKNDIANYILTRDENGLSDFYKDLQNPQALTTAAFWILKGPEIMLDLQAEILEAYKRGYALGSAKQSLPQSTAKSPKVVITPKDTTKNNANNVSTNDAVAAFGDDESYLYN